MVRTGGVEKTTGEGSAVTRTRFVGWMSVAVVLAAALLVGLPSTESQAGMAGIGLELIADGFNSPVHLTSPPDGTGCRFVVDRIGLVYIIDQDGRVLPEPFLDVQDRMVRLREAYDERGLLGFAFHPEFADNGRFYVYYSAPRRAEAPAGWDHTSRVSEFTVSADNPNRADHGSERVILEIDQPQANHNAGALAFGPDGYLYIAVGDGGGANDDGPGHGPMGNAQDVNTLLGKILRIDVNVDAAGREGRGAGTGAGTSPHAATDPGPGTGSSTSTPSEPAPYAIPPDNPFAAGGGRPEIYAWGFRNPFRMSFDRGGRRELFVADVGQNLWEEVSIVSQPGNYGWRIKEGTHWFDPNRPNAVITEGPSTGPRGEPLIDPVIEYRNRKQPGSDGPGITVIGGYVYRGTALPELAGQYVFADWSQSFNRGGGVLMTAQRPDRPGEMWPWQVVLELNAYVLGMGEDADGELYVLTTDLTGPMGSTGKVYKIVPAAD